MHEEQIRKRAYEIYLSRNHNHGSAVEDWLQAEDEVLKAEDEARDEALMESFPASDPPSY